MDSRYVRALMPGVLGELQKQNRTKRYFNDPELWARDHLGVTLWEAQADAARAVVENNNVAIKAGHEVGKSFLAGVLIAWWVDTRWEKPGGCFVVSTAPSFKQINAIVWREVRRFHKVSVERHGEYKRRIRENLPLGDYALNDHALPGYITSDAHWKLPGGIELGYGSKPPDTKDDTMSGIHARYVLAIGDESVGLSEALINDLYNITSNDTSRRVLLCNPTNPLSYTGKIFKNDTGTWALRTISVLDSPNFHGGGRCIESCTRKAEHDALPFGLGLSVEVLESLVGQTYVTNKLRDYGEDHPEYITRVLGEFAWDAGPTLIAPEEMAIALDCEVEITDDLPVLGVDVSRSDRGDKNTVYACYRGIVKGGPTDGAEGERIRYVDSWNDKDAMVTARRINELALAHGAWLVYIDGSGLGGPIGDRVRELAEGRYHCWDAVGGKRDMPELELDRYANCRAKWYSDLRHKIARGYMDIDIADTDLQEELLGIETRFPKQGVQRLLIEGKDDMRKRGVSSPDFADACMYSQIDYDYYNPFDDGTTGRQALDEDEWGLHNEEQRIGGYGVSV